MVACGIYELADVSCFYVLCVLCLYLIVDITSCFRGLDSYGCVWDLRTGRCIMLSCIVCIMFVFNC